MQRAKKTRKMVKKSMKKKSTSRNQSEKQIQVCINLFSDTFLTKESVTAMCGVG